MSSTIFQMKQLLVFLFLALLASGASGQTPLVAIGDSISEGVQSGDASEHTQPFSYLAIMARQMGVRFPLPLIATSPIGIVGSTIGRDRIQPLKPAANLGISGADLDSILHKRSDIFRDSETDLVLWPRFGTQVDIAEQMRPNMLVCFAGSNDVLQAAVDFSHLDASQMTSVAEFTASYTELAARLQAFGKPVVVATLPNVTRIAFLLNNSLLTTFTGVNYNLPAGHYTSFPAALLLRFHLAGPELLQDPNWVLDPAEIQKILQRTSELNAVIAAQAATRGFAVAPVNAMFEFLATHPPVLAGVTLTSGILGGLFSLDGIHPSNTAHALLAVLFLDSLNKRYGTNFQLPGSAALNRVAANDPFVDRNGNGRVTGRPQVGLLETLGPLLGLSGDDETATGAQAASKTLDAVRFLIEYRRLTGRAAMANPRTEVIAALRHMLGLDKFGVRP